MVDPAHVSLRAAVAPEGDPGGTTMRGTAEGDRVPVFSPVQTQLLHRDAGVGRW